MTHQNQSVTTHCISTNLNPNDAKKNNSFSENPFDVCEIVNHIKDKYKLPSLQLGCLSAMDDKGLLLQKKSYLIITQKCFNIQLILEWLWHLNFRFCTTEHLYFRVQYACNITLCVLFLLLRFKKKDLLLLPGSQV